MTKVYYREYYDRYLIIIEGHSGFNEKGKDIVCSAISILVYTLSEALKNEESDKRLLIKKEIINDGYFYMEVEPFDYSKGRTKGIIETIVTGLCLLNEQYPEYVKIE